MRNFVCIIIVLFSVLAGNAQDLSDYSYVRVPEKYDFQDEENKYQLNALTAFLFEKYGFQVLYKQPNPTGVEMCDVLSANVHNESGFLRSKLYVTLENCQGEEVFRSALGVSREKDYKRSYHEALREAFESFEGLEQDSTGVVIVEPSVSKKDIRSLEKGNERSRGESLQSMSAETYRFSNGSRDYLLKETLRGYELYQEGEPEIFARLIRSGRGENFLYSSGAISGNAYFDAKGNLLVEYLDKTSGQLVTVVYHKAQ